MGGSCKPPKFCPSALIHPLTYLQINRHIIPGFYHVLQGQDPEKQSSAGLGLRDNIKKLVDAASDEGPFFLGKNLSIVDVQIAPWIIRLSRVLKPYRGWPDPTPGTRWAAWVDAIESDEHVKATTSSDQLYLDSYERYAREFLHVVISANAMKLTLVPLENRPNTSQLANAINAGGQLP